MSESSRGSPDAHREWQNANSACYADAWRSQRGAPGAPRPFSEWYELNWEISNRYWAGFLDRHATGRRFLECGGATGRLPLQLTREGWHCTLVDVTTEGPLLARERFARARASAWFVTGDVFHLPFADETFDVVYSSGLLDVLPDIASAIREMTRVLRPGGLFVASSNPRRRSVQTVAEAALSLARDARHRLTRRRQRERPSLDSLGSPRPTPIPLFRNDYSLEAHLAACREAGLRHIRGHGVGLLPVVPLPGPLMRGYTRLTRLLTPLCLRFNRSESAWTARWGVMLAIHGRKPAPGEALPRLPA
jgi:SAM-dependent methyltransferase